MSYDIFAPKAFFNLLYNEPQFCAGVGRVMLAAGMLETNLCNYLRSKGARVRDQATLGRMVDLLKANSLLTRNGEMHFDDLKRKRNYLAHSLYDLFAGVIDETLLARSELVAEDVGLFVERAEILAEEFVFFSKIVESADQSNPILL